MGYETKYTFEFTSDSVYCEEDDLIEDIEDVSGYNIFHSVKWYDHEKHMLTVSLKHPEILFTLMGDGEDADDIWVKYFKNGKIQVAKGVITYEAFDPEKLAYR